MKATIILLVLLFGAVTGVSGGQVSQSSVDDLARSLDTSSCAGKFQSGKVVCEIVVPRVVDAKNSKSGDHILLRTYLTTSAVEEPITTLDATIVEVQGGVNSDHVIRIRIDKGVRKDGREVQVEARIVALAAQSSITEGWEFPPVIVDRFPRTPEDDQRLPGEKKLAEDQPHTSPLDFMTDTPVYYRAICSNTKKKASGTRCTNLSEARGVYGYKNLKLEARGPGLRAESLLISKKNIAIRAGTVLVLEVRPFHGHSEMLQEPGAS